jgi:hypothetical protein
MELALALAVASAIAGAVFVLRRRAPRTGRARSAAALAERMDLTYSQVDLFGDGWQPFHFFGLGTRRAIENVLAGTIDDVEVRVFDYSYLVDQDGSFKVVEGRHRFSCGVIAVPASCPKLAVQPRTMTDDLIGLVGGEVLPLELEEFNRRFHVRCEDQRFAIAFLEQRMMGALLRSPLRVALAASDDRILLVARELAVEQITVLLHALAAVRRAFPRSLPSLYPLRAGSSGTLQAVSAAETAKRLARLVDQRDRQRHPAGGDGTTLYPW